jgi:hypothetical protein
LLLPSQLRCGCESCVAAVRAAGYSFGATGFAFPGPALGPEGQVVPESTILKTQTPTALGMHNLPVSHFDVTGYEEVLRGA